MHLRYFLGFQVDFKSKVLDKIWSLDSKSAFFSASWEGTWVKRQFSCKSSFVVLDRIVMENEISLSIEENFVNP